MSATDKSPETTNEGKGEKRGAEDAELDKVHSANNWEGANLGDDDRRQKFLRLMGANKKEHHGRFVIGEKDKKHGRTDEETSMVNRQLEDQYRTGLDLKLSGGARQHKGLGFSVEEGVKKDEGASAEKAPAEQSKAEEKEKSGDKDSESKDSKKDGLAPESTNKDESESKSDETNGKEKKSPGVEMHFVKASS